MQSLLFIEFLSPLHLWGLFLIGIPILIHLYAVRNFKKVIVSDVEFLKKIENSGIARKKLKEILVLITRVLAISFLVIAFSEPVFTDDSSVKKSNSLVKIYLDNSFSMGKKYEGVELLSQAKIIAESIIDEYSVNDRFQVRSNDFGFSSDRTWQKREAKNRIAEVLLSPRSKELKALVSRMSESSKDAMVLDYEPVNFLISDFNFNVDSSDFKNVEEPFYCVPVNGQEVSNVYVDSVWFFDKERKVTGYDTVRFAISNDGKKDLLDFAVNLEVNGNSQIVTIDLKSDARTFGEFVYKVPESTMVKGVVSVKDPVLPFDNQLYFSYPLPDKIKVLVLTSSDDFAQVIEKMFKSEINVLIDVIKEREIAYDFIDAYDMFFIGELSEISSTVNAWLTKIHDTQGKQIVIIPNHDINVIGYNALGAEIGEFAFSEVDSASLELLPVDEATPFFAHVFKAEKLRSNIKMKMPNLKNHYKVLSSKGEILLFKSDETSYLTKSDRLTLFSSGITDSSSDFSKHPLIVPVFYNLVFSAVLSDDLYVTYGENLRVKSKSRWGKVYDFRSQDSLIINGNTDGLRGFIKLNDNFKEAGFYEVLSGDSVLDNLAVNYSRRESKGDFQAQELGKVAKTNSMVTVVENAIDSPGAMREELIGGSYWKLFLVLAGICLLLEMLLLRVVLNRSSAKQ